MYYRFGSNKKIFVDVRIISASNKNLNDSINKGNLREDLFYRLSVAPIEMPSLNNRIEDIPYLIEYFIISLSKDLGKNILNFSPDTLAIFQTYDWPGNLRQLKNILEWLLIMYGDNVDNLYAAIAVMLMLTVVPNMIFNGWRIRREQKELGN